MSNPDTCSDYDCQFPGEGNHSHVGIQPYLRRVMTIDSKLIDGSTGEILEETNERATD